MAGAVVHPESATAEHYETKLKPIETSAHQLAGYGPCLPRCRPCPGSRAGHSESQHDQRHPPLHQHEPVHLDVVETARQRRHEQHRHISQQRSTRTADHRDLGLFSGHQPGHCGVSSDGGFGQSGHCLLRATRCYPGRRSLCLSLQRQNLGTGGDRRPAAAVEFQRMCRRGDRAFRHVRRRADHRGRRQDHRLRVARFQQ